MSRRLLSCSALLVVVGWSFTVVAQPPLPPLGNKDGKSDSLPRLPNDQFEGAVWQYRATRPEGEQVLTGRFRVDDGVVFSLEPEIKLRERPRDGGPLRKIIEGEGGTLKLPEAPQTKRIGECKTLSTGRVRLDFQPDSDLPGFAIVRPKEDATNVWWGTYQAMDGKKKGLKWEIELRKAED